MMPARSSRSAERGVALVITLLALSLVSALGTALLLASAGDRLVAANHDEGTFLLNAAESALALAVRDLAAIDDWNGVLDGSRRSTLVDGPPDGPRTVFPAVVIDLTRMTFQLTCGRVVPCSDAERQVSTLERPWGANNPRWRLFLHGFLDPLIGPRHRQAPYVLVFLGDDGAERDGDPGVDGGGPGQEGRYILRARAESYGARGGRRAIEAELSRICTPTDTDEFCLPGVRVQAWRVVTPVS